MKPYYSLNPQPKTKSQGLVEFALVIPIFLMLVLGIMEAGHLLFVYTSVFTGAREGARYGAAVGTSPNGVPYFRDCAGIKARINELVGFSGVTPTVINVRYDNPDNPSLANTVGCAPEYATAPSDGNIGLEITDRNRIFVTVSAVYNPIVPLVPIPSMTITSATGRTIVRHLEMPGAGVIMPTPLTIPTSASAEAATMTAMSADMTSTANVANVTATWVSGATATEAANQTATMNAINTATAVVQQTQDMAATMTEIAGWTPTGTATAGPSPTPTASNTPTPTNTATPPPTPTATPRICPQLGTLQGVGTTKMTLQLIVPDSVHAHPVQISQVTVYWHQSSQTNLQVNLGSAVILYDDDYSDPTTTVGTDNTTEFIFDGLASARTLQTGGVINNLQAEFKKAVDSSSRYSYGFYIEFANGCPSLAKFFE